MGSAPCCNSTKNGFDDEEPVAKNVDVIQDVDSDDELGHESTHDEDQTPQMHLERCGVSFYNTDYDDDQIRDRLKKYATVLDAGAIEARPALKYLMSGRVVTNADLPKHLPDLSGIWRCVENWGLDDFMRAYGISDRDRRVAVKAPLPWWSLEHSIEKNLIHFINHGAVADVEEFIDLSGTHYITFDARQQKILNKAIWEDSTLVVKRRGPHGKFREERMIDDLGYMQWTLIVSNGPQKGQKWGQKYERQSMVMEFLLQRASQAGRTERAK